MHKTIRIFLGATLLLMMALPLSANPVIPDAVNWSVSSSIVINRGSGAANTSITDIANGVNFHFDAPTGGSGVGTTTRRFDFTTTALSSGIGFISIDVAYNAFLGFFREDYGLQLIRNGAVVHNLIPDTFNDNPVSINATFNNLPFTINAGDTWGVRSMAGNFTECCGYSVNVALTTVPEPTSLLLSGGMLLSLAVRYRRRRNQV